MTGAEVRAARLKLGLTQKQLAGFIGYAHEIRVSEIERDASRMGRAPELLLKAYLAGFRPHDWPETADGKEKQ